MNELRLPGIRFEPIAMPVRTTAAKFKGETIPGIRFVVTNRKTYRPVRTALILIDEIRRQHPEQFRWGPSIDRLTGSDKVRLAIDARHTAGAARGVGPRGRGVHANHRAVPALRLTTVENGDSKGSKGQLLSLSLVP